MEADCYSKFSQVTNLPGGHVARDCTYSGPGQHDSGKVQRIGIRDLNCVFRMRFGAAHRSQ